MKPYDLAQKHLHPYNVRGNEIVARHCPFCHGGEHHDKYTFAMNIETGAFNCHRGKCGKSGGFKALAEELHEEADMYRETRKPPKAYKRPNIERKALSDPAVQYLASRKISRRTMDRYGVSCDEQGNLVFPYTRGGELVFAKYRVARKIKDGERKMWAAAEAEPILFGMDLCVYENPLVICEGEIDALALFEAGVPNAVSVPMGSNNTHWIDLCWDWLEPFATVILCGDADEPGRAMVRELTNRLGAWRCRVVKLPEGRKDANEVLFHDGADALREAVEMAEEVKIKGLVRLADVRLEDATTVESVSSGIAELDKLTGGFLMGELSVWTGKRGGGKSTLAGQTLLDAIDQGYPVCAYSGELRATRFQNWIDQQAAGDKHIQRVFSQRQGVEVSIVPLDIREKIHGWYRESFWLYDNSIVGTPDDVGVLEIFELAARRYGCRVFLVDNLMSSRFKGATERDKWSAQGAFVGELAAFAKRFNAHVHLVAHPRKEDKSAKEKPGMESDDVAGSSEITDRADNVFSITRKPENKAVLRVLKNREVGTMFAPSDAITASGVGLIYQPLSRRLLPESEKNKEYGWTIPEWLRGAEQWDFWDGKDGAGV